MSWPNPREFYDKYRGDTETAKKAAYQIGREIGQALKEKNNIVGSDLNAVASILNAAMRMVQSESSAKVEGGRVVKNDRGFCVIMCSALNLDLPWSWLDENFAWPYLEGLVSVIRPDMKMSVTSARSSGAQACTHIFEPR